MTTNTDFQIPTSLYAINDSDYAGMLCSERDHYSPRQNIIYFVIEATGEVRADVFTNDWKYDLATGLTMTADQITDALI